MEAAMPFEMGTRKRARKLREIVKKTKGACIVEAHESTEKSVPRNHCKLVHKFVPMPQAMKIPDAAKVAVDTEWGKAREVTSMATGEGKEQERNCSGKTTREKKVHFASLMDICHLTNGVRTPIALIVEQPVEILNVSTMMYTLSPLMRSTLCHDQVVNWAKARVHFYSDSV